MLPAPIQYPAAFHGQPTVRLELAEGDACVVALHGAQVLSWITSDGVERLYLSPKALFDGRSAIRGGVPLCWPQFNQRGPLAKHGFARNVAWRVQAFERGSAVLALEDSKMTRHAWPHAFGLRLTVALSPGQLRMTLDVTNPGESPWEFAAALHTYLRVDDIANAGLQGLQGARRWDAVRDEHHVEQAEELRFGPEFDSVYTAPAHPLRLVQPSGTLQISQSPNCTETVVWNPGAALSARLADMLPDGWRHMLCVEAARIDDNVLLPPGATWQAWQQLTVL
jgi:glucose-6-phosphate 1-epimerase